VLQLIDTYVTNIPPKDHESIREIVLLPQKKKQKQLAMLLSTETRSSTMESWKSRHINNPYFNEKLLILNQLLLLLHKKMEKKKKNVSKWLHALPNSGL
jgi:hypothetical protein